MPGALRRLYTRLRLEFARPFEALLPGGNLPEWIESVDFEHAVAQCNADLCGTMCIVETMSLVRAQRRITQLLLALANGATDCDAMPPEPLQPVRLPEDQDPQSLAATVRLCFGEMLEAYAAYRALLLTEATTLPSATASTRVQTEFAQLCHDSYLAAVWTSAHVAYLTTVDEFYNDEYASSRNVQASKEAEEPTNSPPARTAVLIDTLAVPNPELHSVACASNLVDLTALYERVSCPSACTKSAQGLLAIFARVTNAGSRGWESTLNGALKDSEGVARTCAHATGIALTGLHPCVHPAARRPWRLRFTIERYWRSQSTAAFKDLAKRCPSAVKEVMRLHLAALLNEDSATLEALAAARQPAGQLGIPPRCVAPASLQASMHAFAAAGELLTSDEEPRALAEIVSSLLATEPRSRKRNSSAAPVAPMDKAPTSHAARLLLVGASSLSSGSKRRSSSANNASLAHAALVSDAQTVAEWHAGSALMLTRLAPASGSNGYCAAVPATMAGAASCSAVSIVSGLLAASFRAEFVPFWLHSQAHGVRASRLDGVQYRALHEQSPAHQLCTRLSDENRLRVYRLALRVPSSSLLTVQEAAALLGIRAEEGIVTNSESTADEEDTLATNDANDTEETELAEESCSACVASSRIVQEAETFVLSLGATDAALMIEFARASALRAHLLTYDLGPRTRRAQATAICRRLLLPLAEDESPEEAALHRLPAHCTTLFLCSECRRVANACQNGEGKDLPFNELGLAASMLHVDGDVTRGTMKCAKRSSAALRTALLLEETADTLAVEGLAIDEEAGVPIDLRPSSVVQAVAEARPASASAAKLVREAPASEVAKLRRDIKNCMDQRERAIACGDVPLVSIPILGRAIRVYGEWHALCAWCGCLAKISPDSRVGGEVCCMRCDFGMLHGKAAAAEAFAQEPRPPPPVCRYCNKAQAEGGTSKWKQVAAPADTGGPNANVPPPLRKAWYCPAHWRSWLPTAHQSMRTSEIFAHICSKARPMIGADKDAGGDDVLAEQRAAAATVKPKRTRAMKSINKKLNQQRRNRQSQQH